MKNGYSSKQPIEPELELFVKRNRQNYFSLKWNQRWVGNMPLILIRKCIVQILEYCSKQCLKNINIKIIWKFSKWQQI